MSPESNNRLLNPYQQSAEMSSKRFSSINRNKQTSCSPANIKLEPVRMVTTTAFEAQ